jgi:hypothetical protein
MSVLKNFIQNWSTINLDYKTYIITEDMCDVVVDSTKWVAPYNTSYWMTWITIKDWYWVEWREWWMYRFIIDIKLVVVSATRNVGIRIGTNWTYIPMKNRWNTILAWSSYMIKARTDEYMYKTTYESWWALHLCAGSDTTYSTMSVSEWKTWTATSWRIMRSDYLKQIIEYHAWNLTTLVKTTWNQTIAWTKTFSTSPVIPSKTADVGNTWTAIATEAQVYNILPTVMTASEYSQVSNPVAGKIYFIKKS